MTVEFLAPAKVNLGLEVIRKRDDGFHEIATVFQTISLFDRLRIERAENDAVVVTNRIEQIEENLVSLAVERARSAGVATDAWHIEIHKRIPLAAGLGGASSDAAATLRGIASAGTSELADIALTLGSDVPFFLVGGAALASGRGEILEPLPRLPSCWFVLVSPLVELERKTARLYGSLEAGDFSDGSRIARTACALRAGAVPHPDDLANAFSRPLARLLPEIDSLVPAMREAGAPFVALTGAGPTHYTIVPELSAAMEIARRLAGRPPLPLRVLLARPTAAGMLMREKTSLPNEAL
ncbi:MAG: 4-(cytidine 5'-diphospho)-2-C-methyl-D-erythritol kinase [Thermomicrobiales bacterium]